MIALLLAVALSQGYNSAPPGISSGKVLASFPLTTSGPLITEDANTVAHVYWNGTALVDTKGNAWAMTGTVPQVIANPFTTTRYGAGPFSDANYYSSAGGASGTVGTWCVVFNITSLPPAYTTLVGGSGAGNIIQFSDAPPVMTLKLGGGGNLNAGNATVGVNVACVGASGGTAYSKLNLAATITGSAASTADGVIPVLIGKYSTDGYSFPGTIYEVYATTSPFTEATVTAIQQKVLGHYDGSAPLAVTRATLATYQPTPGTGPIFTVPPGVARITTDGLLVEPARTNYALASDGMSTGTAATSPWTLSNATVATVAGAPIGTWAEVTSSTSVGSLYQNTTTASATGWVASAWMAKASGTGAASVVFTCVSGTATATGCLRSDGGACTATQSGANAWAYVTDLGTTPVRLSVTATCASAATNTYITLSPGQYSVSTGTTRFAAADLQVGAFPTSHISVGGTSTLRAADQISATVPAVPSKWCIAVTAKPEEGRAWGTSDANSNTLWSIGADATNAARLVTSTTSLSLVVKDAANAIKTWASAAAPSLGSHRFVACNTSGVGSISLDGTPLSLSASGAGAGVMASPATTLFFGYLSPYAGLDVSGYLKNLKICAAKSAKECK